MLPFVNSKFSTYDITCDIICDITGNASIISLIIRTIYNNSKGRVIIQNIFCRFTIIMFQSFPGSLKSHTELIHITKSLHNCSNKRIASVFHTFNL